MSEYRLLYWVKRGLANGQADLSQTHLFHQDRQLALCGRTLPRGDQDVMWDDSDGEDQLCKRCLVSAERIARKGKR